MVGKKRKKKANEYNTGRWSDDEHAAFLRGLELHGREWKRVASAVGTRSVLQARTHAQKYFDRLQSSSAAVVNIKDNRNKTSDREIRDSNSIEINSVTTIEDNGSRTTENLDTDIETRRRKDSVDVPTRDRRLSHILESDEDEALYDTNSIDSIGIISNSSSRSRNKGTIQNSTLIENGFGHKADSNPSRTINDHGNRRAKTLSKKNPKNCQEEDMQTMSSRGFSDTMPKSKGKLSIDVDEQFTGQQNMFPPYYQGHPYPIHGAHITSHSPVNGEEKEEDRSRGGIYSANEPNGGHLYPTTSSTFFHHQPPPYHVPHHRPPYSQNHMEHEQYPHPPGGFVPPNQFSHAVAATSYHNPYASQNHTLHHGETHQYDGTVEHQNNETYLGQSTTSQQPDIILPITARSLEENFANRQYIDLLRINNALFHSLVYNDQYLMARNICHFVHTVLNRHILCQVDDPKLMRSGDGAVQYYPVSDPIAAIMNEFRYDAFKASAQQQYPFWLLGEYDNDPLSIPSPILHCNPNDGTFDNIVLGDSASRGSGGGDTRIHEILSTEGVKNLLLLPASIPYPPNYARE